MVSRSELWAAVLAAIVVVTAASPAIAGDSPESEQARYREAHRAISKKDWSAARELLLPLWADSPTYDVASSLALVEYQLGDYPMAARHLAFALEHVAPVEKPETVERMRLGMLELRGKVGGLRLSASEPSAIVTLDGQTVAPQLLGRELFVAPGRHTIEAHADGRTPGRQVLEVLPGQTYTVELELHALPIAPSPPASATRRLTPPARGSEAEHARERPWWPVLVGGSLTATGLGMAIGFGVAANDAESEWRSRRDGISSSGCAERPASLDCRKLRDAIDRQHGAATWSRVGIGVSVLSVAATAAYVLLWPSRSESTPAARVSPSLSVGSNGAELGLSGAF